MYRLKSCHPGLLICWDSRFISATKYENDLELFIEPYKYVKNWFLDNTMQTSITMCTKVTLPLVLSRTWSRGLLPLRMKKWYSHGVWNTIAILDDVNDPKLRS